MRLQIPGKRRQKASVLLTALALAMILGLTLAGYLSWVRTQNVLVAESQAWNAALAHAEAGIEEGMAQINVNFGTNYLSSAQTNWVLSTGAGFYGPRKYSFTNGSYSAIIVPNGPGPTLISTGYAMVPLVGRQISRVVEVRTKPESTFGYSIAVLHDVVMGGNYVMVDSYDSTDPLHNTGGLYDPNKRKAGGDVISTDGIVAINGANVYGHVRTAPWGSISVQQSNGRVGDLEANWPNRSGIEDGWYANDLNLDFTNVREPFTAATASLSFNASTNTYLLDSNDYLVTTNFDLRSDQTLYISGNTRLWVKGSFRSYNGSTITIAPNSRLELYVGTKDGPPVSGDVANVNTAGYAVQFAYYGLPSNTTMTWSGNQTFNGAIYAPQTVMTLQGGGATRTNDFQGACVVGWLNMGGHFNYHFDESLKTSVPPKGFVGYSWREL